MNFSSRTNWQFHHNRLTKLLEARRVNGLPIFDLTVSNPTECGFNYPEQEILSALSDKRILHYQPDPRGLFPTREAVAKYYRGKNIHLDPSNIFLTSSTSEAYSTLFKLLCNNADDILVPRPSYPLFDYLAQLNDINLCHYDLFYDHGWHLNLSLLKKAITTSTKAIVLINPHNPSGMFLKKNDYTQIAAIAREHNIALIVDEVFIDFSYHHNADRIETTCGKSDVLTFTLNGISKMAGMPQMKLGWIVMSGTESMMQRASERLEIILDTYLSVNTPVQVALPELMHIGKNIHAKILDRVKANFEFLQNNVALGSSCSLLDCEGGWYGIIRVPRIKSEEEWCLQLIKEYGVSVYPGYYFDFSEDCFLIVSLLPESAIFKIAIQKIIDCAG